MKTITKPIPLYFILGFLFFSIPNANAQLLKKLQKKAEDAVERKLEQKVEKETERTMDTILNPNEKSPTKKTPQTNQGGSTNKTTSKTNETQQDVLNNENLSDNLEIYSKFDFVPGDKLLFFDDFSQDFVGDFPSKWNTNASGEVVKMNNIEGNWFEFKPGHGIYYIPDLKSLPEDYTIEFDLLTSGIDGQTSVAASLEVILSDNSEFNYGSNHYVQAVIPFCQYSIADIHLRNFFNRANGDINSNITADIRKEVLNQPHISIAVTKNRYRLWVNETKYVDIPRMITELNVLNYIKFHID